MANKHIVTPSRLGVYAGKNPEKKVEPLLIKDQVYGGVPTLSCALDDGKIKPLLLFYHGFSQDKYDQMQMICDLANEGYYVVVPEIMGHGQRDNPENLRTFDLFKTTLGEMDDLLEALTEEVLVDTGKIALAGTSFGGMVVYHALAFSKRPIKAAAVMSSTPDLLGLLSQPAGFLTVEMACGEKPFAPPTAEEKARIFEEAPSYSPLVHWEKISHLPTLLVHGQKDPLIAPEADEALYDLLAPMDQEDQLTLYLYEGVGHELKPEMKNLVVDWFGKQRPLFDQ